MTVSRLSRLAWTSALLLAVACACLLSEGAPRADAGEVFTYTEGLAFAPFSFEALDPSLTTGAAGDQRLQFVLPVNRDMPATAIATTGPLDFGKPAQDKEFLSLAWGSTLPRGANLFLSYSVDGRAWLPAIGDLGFDIPDGTHGKSIAYRASLTTSDPESTPILEFLTIEYTRWTGEVTKPPSGGGGGGSHQPGASHKPGSGSYTYPPTGVATPAPVWWSGAAGSGDTVGGPGSGRGTGPGGAGSGSGGGTGTSAPSEQSPVVQATTQASVPVPAPPASTPVGPSQSVSGLPVDPDAPVITGVPLEPSGAGGLTGGGDAPVAASAGFSFPFGQVAVVTAALAALFIVPWLIGAAGLRRITGHDFERARLFGPFRLLRR